MCIKCVFSSYKTISTKTLINYLKCNLFLCQIYVIHVQNYKYFFEFSYCILFILYLIIFKFANLE